jgi:AraC family transcriptional regulator of adaptative response/methylated-DNA-[protein]-cysteine methyltransferase
MSATAIESTVLRLVTEDDLYQALIERDARVDGRVFYGITSTGIYCRPTCAARKPLRRNVRYFHSPEAAERAGFRACKRCQPRSAQIDPRMALVERVVADVGAHLDDDCSLAAVAARLGAGQHHLHRTFKAMLGITLKGYVDTRRTERVKDALRDGREVTTALYEAGFGSSRGLYERAGSTFGMTPGAYRAGGHDAHIHYAVARGPLGWVIVGTTSVGVCAIALGDDPQGLVEGLRREFPAAEIEEDVDGLAETVRAVLTRMQGQALPEELSLDLRATAFQRRVWEELQRIPRGETRTYGEIARAIERPSAARAVAGACAANPVAIVVPCHRVVRGDGGLGGYRWGIDRKSRLLAGERSDPGV